MLRDFESDVFVLCMCEWRNEGKRLKMEKEERVVGGEGRGRGCVKREIFK